MVEKMLHPYVNGNPVRQASLVVALVISCLWLAGNFSYQRTKGQLRALEEESLEQEAQLLQMRLDGESRRRQLREANERLLSLLQSPTEPNITVEGSAPDVGRQLETGCTDCWSHWRIHGDGCEYSPTDAHCIQSKNYPGNHPLSSGCFIEIAENPDFWIVWEDFQAFLVVRGIFTEIAVDFQPSALSGTEATLHIKAEEIAARLTGPMTSLSDKVYSFGKHRLWSSDALSVSVSERNSMTSKPNPASGNKQPSSSSTVVSPVSDTVLQKQASSQASTKEVFKLEIML